MQWFRMYSEFATDPKVQSMSETFQRRFTMFLCLHCNGEFEQLNDHELAFSLRITVDELHETRELFKQKGFLDAEGKIRNWNKRQYKSDTSTERVKKHRENKVKLKRNVSETPSETDSETDSERTQNPSASATPTRKASVKVLLERHGDPAWWVEFRSAYPKRAGDQGWRKATRAAHARIAEGHTAAEFIAGARRYADFCEATGKLNTEFVKQACTFLGPDKPFLLPWKPPPKPETATERLLRNLNGTEDSRVIEHEPDTSRAISNF
jgi:hypothetical protein